MKDATNSKKTKLVSKLNKKMDLIKHEMYNTTRYRRKCRNVIDFEKKQKTSTYKHSISESKKVVKKTVSLNQRLRGLYEYLWDLRIMPLYKILKDSRKIVLFYEWVYFYQEIEIIPHGNEVLKECKKKNNPNIILESNKEEMREVLNRVCTPNLGKIIKLNNSIKQYFNRVSQILPEGFNLSLKNNPSLPIFIKRHKEELHKQKDEGVKDESTEPPIPTPTEKYKTFLSIFTECVASKSIFFKFTKTINGNNLHQSFMNCFKRIPPSRQECKGVKDLCMSYTPSTSPFMEAYEEGEEEEEEGEGMHEYEYKDDDDYDDDYASLDHLVPSKFKIESIDLYLKGIDPNVVTTPPGTINYPFDPSKLGGNVEKPTQTFIENNLYGNEDV